MSASTRQLSRNGLALAALFAVCAQAADSIGAENYVARAKEFLGRFYPSLDSRLRVVTTGHLLRDSRIMLPDVMNRFTMDLYGPERKWGEPVAVPSSPDPVLTADFTFDWHTERKELVNVRIWGPAVDSRKEKLGHELNKHPDWSEAQVTAALNEAGAKYGPDHKAEFLSALPFEQLRPYVGGELKIVSMEFWSHRPHNYGDGLTETGLHWLILARWRSPDGRQADCTMSFDPFEGWLTMLIRDPVEPTKPAESGRR